MIAVAKDTRKPKYAETTGPQTISYSFGDGILKRDYTNVGTYEQLRAVRRNPTVALARGLLISCIQAGSWNIEADEGVRKDAIKFMEHILPLREDLLYNAVAYGKVDFGWIGFEKLFEVMNDRIFIKELKPLLHDMTHILVTSRGRYDGYRQMSIGFGTLGPTGLGGPTYPVDLKVEKCLHLAFGVEAGNYYGMPLLENIREVQDMWDECNDGARRYDKKIAGTLRVVYYPPGSTEVAGEQKDNGLIAADMLKALESSGSVSLPSTVAEVFEEVTNNVAAKLYGWRIELLSETKPRQESFSKRLKYLDALMARGLLMLERAVLEGQHGTKAEAGEHIGLMITNMQEIDKAITRMVNQQLVNQLLRLNFGEELVNKVRLASAPLIDEQIGFLRELYVKKLSDPNVDLSVLKDELGVPEKEGASATQEPEPKEEDEENDEDLHDE